MLYVTTYAQGSSSKILRLVTPLRSEDQGHEEDKKEQ